MKTKPLQDNTEDPCF